TLDPALINEVLSTDISQNLYDSVTQFNPQTLEVEPALAESWDVSPDASVYTFHIRRDAKFSNGDPVTAEDIKYSWNRTLSTKEAPYASYVMSDIKGASEVMASATATDTTKQKITEASGIEVIDPYTLRVTLVRPSAYFLAEAAVWTYYVVNKNV